MHIIKNRRRLKIAKALAVGFIVKTVIFAVGALLILDMQHAASAPL